MLIDAATRANLELTATLAGDAAAAACSRAIDRTVTGAGARLLAPPARRPARPIRATIGRRLDAVAWLLADAAPPDRRSATALAAAPDLARALSRLALDRGGPRDLAAIRAGLAAAAEIVADARAGDEPARRDRRRVAAASRAAPPPLAAELARGARRRAAAPQARRRLRPRRLRRRARRGAEAARREPRA